jgi:transposase InsO family protein
MWAAWKRSGRGSAWRPPAIPTTTPRPRASWQTLKPEEVYLKDYQTFADAQAHLGQFIEEVYTTTRLHSSLGYLPPAEFAASHTQPILELPLPVVR